MQLHDRWKCNCTAKAYDMPSPHPLTLQHSPERTQRPRAQVGRNRSLDFLSCSESQLECPADHRELMSGQRRTAHGSSAAGRLHVTCLAVGALIRDGPFITGHVSCRRAAIGASSRSAARAGTCTLHPRRCSSTSIPASVYSTRMDAAVAWLPRHRSRSGSSLNGR